MLRFLLIKELFFFSAGRYAVISGSGDLHIRSVKPDDSLNKFSCVTINSLNGERRLSDAVYLSVKGNIYFKLY